MNYVENTGTVLPHEREVKCQNYKVNERNRNVVVVVVSVLFLEADGFIL